MRLDCCPSQYTARKSEAFAVLAEALLAGYWSFCPRDGRLFRVISKTGSFERPQRDTEGYGADTHRIVVEEGFELVSAKQKVQQMYRWKIGWCGISNINFAMPE